MASSVDALVEQFMALGGGVSGKRPETEEEIAASLEQSARRKEFLKTSAAAMEPAMKVGALEKQLGKAAKKILKAAAPAKAKTKAPKPPAEEQAAKKAAAAKADADAKAAEPPEEDLDEQIRKVLGAPEKNVGRPGEGSFHVNSPAVLAAHLSATAGHWQLRFPPEPNGFLHIGHAKAMSINFGTARANGGRCYLRFDDTNPEAEKQEYIDSILENVAWLGYEPFKVTYTSDYFPKLYELAQELVRRGKAYVSLLDGDAVKAQRDALKEYHNNVARAAKAGTPLAFPEAAVFDEGRVRSPEANLALLAQMKEGRFEEGAATLRMKADFTSSNPNMWDHMAYRVMFKEHHRTGSDWCIYPTYDFSHCLVDSLENVTHSLCTLEFQDRQSPDASYHWLLEALGMYHPMTYETSRCSISCNVMSKRRLHRLVEDGLVAGWDDPRLLTLAGLRRRGYTASAVNDFCRGLGFARSSNEVCVAAEKLEFVIRAELDAVAPRRFAVVDPVEVVIANFADSAVGAPAVVRVPNHPGKGADKEAMGARDVPFTSTVFIPREKFRLDMVKGYKGMVPGSAKNSTVKLLNAGVLTYQSHDVDAASGSVTTVVVTMEPWGTSHKGLPTVAWVPSGAVDVEARFYGRLFSNCTDSEGVERNAEAVARERNVDFAELLNQDSLTVKRLLVEPGIVDELEGSKGFQFITVGYFCTDSKDSSKEKPVFNQVVSLKEDKSKANIK